VGRADHRCGPALGLQSCALVNPKGATAGTAVPTLGDLLPEARSGRGIPEADWVRQVHAIAAGDQLALRALYERTHRIVFTLVVRICGSREMAEEVTLDVFHGVWRTSAQYDPEAGPVVGWILIQARSRAIDRVRFEQRKKRVDPHPDEEAAVTTSGPADAIDAVKQRLSLHQALTELTSGERDAIETAFFSEKTYAETAAHLDQPIGTVKTRVRSGLAKLRKALGTEGSDV
jgi:RNA polymerase sigma-70 factor (ECF subfamily)